VPGMVTVGGHVRRSGELCLEPVRDTTRCGPRWVMSVLSGTWYQADLQRPTRGDATIRAAASSFH